MLVYLSVYIYIHAFVVTLSEAKGETYYNYITYDFLPRKGTYSQSKKAFFSPCLLTTRQTTKNLIGYGIYYI